MRKKIFLLFLSLALSSCTTLSSYKKSGAKSSGIVFLKIKKELFKKLSKENLKGILDQIDRLQTFFFDKKYKTFSLGTFENLENIHLRWIDGQFFEYIPDPDKPFAFIRFTGEKIIPGRMFTDGGSIPRIFWWKKGLSPWEYGPAYLIHDWEFDLHRCKRGKKSFKDVRNTMMEAVKTLMESPLTKKRKRTFYAIYGGINSHVAHIIWKKKTQCALP